MKLERLEELKKISTKNLIVNEVLKNLGDKYYYNKYEIEISLALVIFTIFGDKNIHKQMEDKDIDWINFINENYKLVEELLKGEYQEDIKDILEEIHQGTAQKQKYNRSINKSLELLKDFFSEDNLKKIQESLKQEQ